MVCRLSVGSAWGAAETGGLVGILCVGGRHAASPLSSFRAASTETRPVDTRESRAAFDWLTGGPAPVGEDGFTLRYRRRVA